MVPRHPRRLVYLGTPEIAVAPLRALVAAGFDVALVVSGADKRRGRGRATSPSPVKAAALELGLTVTDDLEQAAEVNADLGVVVAFGRIIPRSLLEQLPMINLHFSLLPRWRGAAPVERAILAGDPSTGVCVMAVEEGLDTGAVFARVESPIGEAETARDLRSRLTDLGSDLLVTTLVAGMSDPVPQSGDVTYAAKISPDDLRIDWSRSASEIERVVRVGGAWTTRGGRRLKIHRVEVSAADLDGGPPGSLCGTVVATGGGAVELVEVQPEGRPPMSALAYLNGARAEPGEVLGTEPEP